VLDGRYRIERRIGEGRVGVVYAAHHVALDKPVAVKILRREMSGDGAAVRRFSQEAKAASRVGHPAIADVTDFGEFSEQVYLVMEYLEGQTLEQLLRDKGRLPVGRALRIGRQIARGLHAAHVKGILHRDLKPANVFLQEVYGGPERVKVLDFGLAKISLQPRTTMMGAFLGTPEYIAPELCKGEESDGRVDVYALGVMLYEMLCGQVPFRGPSPTQTMMMHISQPVAAMETAHGLHVPTELEAVVMQALQKNPADRFATMAALDAALGAVAARLDPPVTVRAPEAPPAKAAVLAAPLPAVAKTGRPPAHEPIIAKARVGRPAFSLPAWPTAIALLVASLSGATLGAWLAGAHAPAPMLEAVRQAGGPADPVPLPSASSATMLPPPPAVRDPAADDRTVAPLSRRRGEGRLRPSRRGKRPETGQPAAPVEPPAEASPPAPGLLPFPRPEPR